MRTGTSCFLDDELPDYRFALLESACVAHETTINETGGTSDGI